ncbi:MAG TPA: oligopeptide/dipeptide ABC transporter ATP-binding protein [Hyphomicrobiaceae bacterium]|nr:oligopeptide/dipeptide ABC transporter ATP-binding protein [Hyphomicrobiaceae bacterium]
MSAGLVEVEGLSKHFPGRRGILAWRAPPIRAVDDVSFSIERGEVVGLVGESGSGKSTIGRCVVRLIEPTAGTVRFDGQEIGQLSARKLRSVRRRMQIVFQDPYASLDPRKRIEDIIGDVLDIHGLAAGRRRDRVAELVSEVGLGTEHLARFPHQFSGGQRQRISIARALASGPDFLVADEPVSALDVSVQAQIVNLLADLRRQHNLTMLFVSHDLSVVEYLSDRVIVLYLGRIVELAPAGALYARPAHPYTRALLSATPMPDPDAKRSRIALSGEMPSPANPPAGCAFHTRCPHAIDLCRRERPRLSEAGPGHAVACWRAAEI